MKNENENENEKYIPKVTTHFLKSPRIENPNEKQNPKLSLDGPSLKICVVTFGKEPCSDFFIVVLLNNLKRIIIYNS